MFDVFTEKGVKILLLTFLCSFIVGIGVGIFGLCMVIDALAKCPK
jgi:hypothetical protein